MKKFIVAILVAFPTLVVAQSAYYDALELTKLLRGNGGLNLPNPAPADDCKNNPERPGCKAAAILRKYSSIIDNDYRVIAKDYKDKNPFINAYIVVPGAASVDGSKVITNVLSNAGGLDVTNFADGIARFLVKRMKEELNVIFFEQFEKELEKQKDLQLLFPSTYSILATAKTEIYNYQKYLPALRQAFEYDLDEFLTNSYSWSIAAGTDLPLLGELRKDTKVHNTIKLLFYVTKELDHGQHPGDVLHTVSDQKEIDFNALFADCKSYLRAADLFSQSIRSTEDSRYWITKKEAEVFSDLTFLRIYLGLVYQKTPADLKFTVGGTEKELKVILADLAADLTKAQSFVTDFTREAAQAEDAISRITKDKQNVKGSDYFAAAKSIVSLSEVLIESNLVSSQVIDPSVLQDVKFYTDHSSYLFANIESRAYSAAVFEAYTILNKALEKNPKPKDVAAVLKPFLKYGGFVASVTSAEDSQEVADAIEAVALPTGSARIKREVAWNVSLNAYLGWFYGSETIKVNGVNDTGNASGIFAPVGIAVSRNFRICKANFSASLFGSIIDVGALASYRLNGDNGKVETLPQVKLENIISPGAYLVLGLPRIPISIGYGYQISPQLRGVSDTSVKLENRADRWAGFIAVDIPLANLWSKPRSK